MTAKEPRAMAVGHHHQWQAGPVIEWEHVSDGNHIRWRVARLIVIVCRCGATRQVKP